VRPWQARPLASVDPRLSCDALVVQARPAGPVQTQAVYLALGSTRDGAQACLGLWRSESAGAQCGLSVVTDRTKRGGTDCVRACVDGLPGLPEAREAVWPHSQVQVGRVPQVRHSLRYGPWRARRAVAAD
jgi:transposase-like protein